MNLLRGIVLLTLVFSHLLTANESKLHQVCSLNLWGWGPDTSSRTKKIKEFLVDQKNLEGSKVLFVQEAIDGVFSSTAAELGKEMGWNSYFVKRKGDAEGIAIIFHPTLKVLSKDFLHLQAKHDDKDYSRIAMSLLIEDPILGKIRYINTHLAHELHMSETRKRQLQEILDWLKTLEAKNTSQHIIFGGDFNTGPTEPYYADEFGLLEESTFAFNHIDHIGADHTWSNLAMGPYLKKELVDHFFVSSNPATTCSPPVPKTSIIGKTIEDGLSDHALLRLNLVFEKE